MKTVKRIFFFSFVLLGVAMLMALATGNVYMIKSLAYNFANVDDYKKFDNDTIHTGNHQPWAIASHYNQRPLPDTMANYLQSIETGALLVIKNDSIVFESYWDGFSDSSLSGSFSVAKSITGLLIGCAIKEGAIKSVNQPVKDFIPEFSGNGKETVTIEHLLTMSSGSDFSESYINPFSITANLYYGNNLRKIATEVNIVHKPGTYHNYKSGDTQLLGLVLEKATGKKMALYAQEKLWKPLGANQPALWSTDKKGGATKAYCCFNSNARDFAKIGQLMLQKGTWNGISIIDSTYFANSTTAHQIPDETGLPCNYYGYQWWIAPKIDGVFYARGILGQYIIVMPSQNAVVVRLGKIKSDVLRYNTPKLLYDLSHWVPTL
jgi:CubicO group peptidase (beta-lactamase class C family)